MKVAIHQPNFIPWIGYFQKISLVDKFILFDNIQLERGKTFTSRTKILIQGKEHWLTVPTINKSNCLLIKDTQIDNSSIWKKKHLRTLNSSYKKASFFDEVFPIIENAYSCNSTFITDYNIPLIKAISNYLGLRTEFFVSSEIAIPNVNVKGFEKIKELLKAVGATSYLSGSGAGSKRYIDEEQFVSNKIQLKWQSFEIKPYNQLNTNTFIPGLSILDLLFNCGHESVKYL